MAYEMKIGGGIAPKDGEGNTIMEKFKDALYKFKMWDSGIMCQEKLDGWYGVAVKNADGTGYWEAGWEQYGTLQEILKVILDYMPNDSVLCGEVGYGTAAETQWAADHGYHRFIIFDSPKWGGIDLTSFSAYARYDILHKFHHETEYSKVVDPAMAMVECKVGCTPEEAWEMFEKIYNRGGEGLVLKLMSGKYKPGSRSSEQWKVKKYVTKDYVIMGFEGTDAPTYLAQGMTVSNIICGLYVDGVLTSITKTSGFDFNMRKEFSDNPNNYIGKVCELGGFEIFKSGAMRHSMFIRMREDRVPEDCVL